MSKWILTGFADEIDSSLDTQMDIMNRLGIKYIEMRNVNGKNLVHYTLQEVNEIKKQLDSKGFKLSAIGSPIGKINITDPFEPHLDLFKHTMEIAALMDAPYIRMFSFYMPKDRDPAEYREAVLERWNKFLAVASGFNVVLLHENEKGIYGDTPERCLDLLDTLDSKKTAAVFDPANFVQCNVETYPHAYFLLKGRIKYFHIKDAEYATGKVVPSGLGGGQLFEILQDAFTSGFEGFLSLEPHLGSYNRHYIFDDTTETTLSEGGPLQFQIAADALKKILKQIQ